MIRNNQELWNASTSGSIWTRDISRRNTVIKLIQHAGSLKWYGVSSNKHNALECLLSIDSFPSCLIRKFDNDRAVVIAIHSFFSNGIDTKFTQNFDKLSRPILSNTAEDCVFGETMPNRYSVCNKSSTICPFINLWQNDIRYVKSRTVCFETVGLGGRVRRVTIV